MSKTIDIYTEAKRAHLEIDSHYSDLYLRSGPEADALVRLRRLQSGMAPERKFTSNIDGKSWWDIPFAFSPYWEKRQRKA